ncbi:MAG: CheR family methyltransferase, partial [Candidatus Omnitrophota bacterium]
DIDMNALLEARNMTYSKERLKAMDGRLIEKYFDKAADGKFILKSYVRNMVRLRQHDIVKDKPYLRCDIVLCRNLLIYFNRQLQEETILKFYECLNPGGFLVLGMVESLIGSAAKMFEHVDNRLRIYRRPEEDEAKGTGSVMSQEDIDRIVKDMLSA